MAFTSGGLVLSPRVVSVFDNTLPNITGKPNPQTAIITGEDGNRYYILGGSDDGAGSGSPDIAFYNADTGASAFTLTGSAIVTAADSINVTPVGGNVVSGTGNNAGAVVPETPYFIVIAGGASGVDTDKRVLVYKINSSGAAEILGGYAGRTGGLNVQQAPAGHGNDDFSAVGFINARRVTNANRVGIPYEYPIAFAYLGEGRANLTVIPSINYILDNTPIVESDTDHWLDKIHDLETNFGNNIFDIAGISGLYRNRGFFLPVGATQGTGGSRFVQLFRQIDLDEHVAATASPANSFLTTNAPNHTDGLVSSIDIDLTTSADIFGFGASVSNIIVPFHSMIRDTAGALAYPFADEGENFDESTGTAANNYYLNPTVVPSDFFDMSQPWFLFFPRVYKTSPGSLGVRVGVYNPRTNITTLVDFNKAAILSIGTDVASGWAIETATFSWDRESGKLTALVRGSGGGNKGIAVVELGTYTPQQTESLASDDTNKVRCWSYEQDNHAFYVMRLGAIGTFVYDITTGEWSEFATSGFTSWNAEFGRLWKNRPIALSQSNGKVWELDPRQSQDQGSLDVTTFYTGGIAVRGHDQPSIGAVRLTGSFGEVRSNPATISMRYSDDAGRTFSAWEDITLSQTDTTQEIAWRALGSVKAPGRVFEFRDVGGMVRVNDAEVETDDDA